MLIEPTPVRHTASSSAPNISCAHSIYFSLFFSFSFSLFALSLISLFLYNLLFIHFISFHSLHKFHLHFCSPLLPFPLTTTTLLTLSRIIIKTPHFLPRNRNHPLTNESTKQKKEAIQSSSPPRSRNPDSGSSTVDSVRRRVTGVRVSKAVNGR